MWEGPSQTDGDGLRLGVAEHSFEALLAAVAGLLPTAEWEFDTARQDSPEALKSSYDETVRRVDLVVDEALSRGGLDAESVRPRRQTGETFTLRWILVHLIEEYARHNGHADLLRERIDGRIGQ